MTLIQKNPNVRFSNCNGVTADDNDTKNPNAKFTNWRDSHKQMYKEKMIFAMKDKDSNKQISKYTNTRSILN